jgi:hypothetical protein
MDLRVSVTERGIEGRLAPAGPCQKHVTTIRSDLRRSNCCRGNNGPVSPDVGVNNRIRKTKVILEPVSGHNAIRCEVPNAGSADQARATRFSRVALALHIGGLGNNLENPRHLFGH